MPTTRPLAAVTTIALLGGVGACWADDVLQPPSWERQRRAAVTSSGPAGLPRTRPVVRRDPAVEPASFVPTAAAAPMTAPTAIDRETATPAPPSEPRRLAESPAETVRASTERYGQQTDEAVRDSTSASLVPATDEPAVDGTAESDPRRLVPRSTLEPNASAADALSRPMGDLLAWRPSSETLTVTGGGVAVAVGLVLALAWIARRCQPRAARPLPKDVVEVLGRASLGGKQTTQLVRVGAKLVLIAHTAEGAKTLTEITDPDEVQRLVAACGGGSTRVFDELLDQMAGQPASGGFLGDEATHPSDRFLETGGLEPGGVGVAGLGREGVEASFDPRSLAAAYANTPGGRERG